MPEKTKQKKDSRRSVATEIDKSVDEEPGNGEKGNWSEDQKEKSYYYDDAYGYEIYKPDEEDESDISPNEK